MSFNLVDNWYFLIIFNQMFQVSFHEITNPNILDFALLFQFNQSLPSLKPNLSILNIINLQLTDAGPMNQYQVKIPALQFFNYRKACLLRLLTSLLSGCNFAGDIKLRPIDLELFQYLSDLDLVSVDTGGVDMFVADFERIFQPLEAVVAFEFISAVAQNGDLVSAVEFDF